MGTTSLRKLLKSLCHNSPWEYAVFWKLKHRSRMLLTWEDGYCNHPSWNPAQDASNAFNFSEVPRLASSDCETSTCNGISAAYPVGLAVSSMSCLLYSLGEGLVGSVASTGKHCWIVTDEFNSMSPSEYPEEWQLQFTVGIKTVLLLPVVPHGVVQLGSLEKVTEDMTLVTDIKNMFNTLQHAPMASEPLDYSRDPSSTVITSFLLKSLAAPSSNSSGMLGPNLSELMEEKDLMALDGIRTTQSNLSAVNEDIISQFVCQENLRVQGKIVADLSDAEFSSLLMGSTAVSVPSSQISDESHWKLMEPDIPDFSYLEEDLLSSSQSNFSEHGFSSRNNLTRNFSASGDMMCQPLEDETCDEIEKKSFHGFLNFPADCELHKALVPAFYKKCIDNDPIISGDEESSLIYHTNFARVIESIGESSGWLTGGGDAGNLLNGVISDSCDASGDIPSNRSNSVKSPTTSSGWVSAPFQAQSQSKCHTLGDDNSGPWNSTKSVFVSPLGSSSGSSLKSMMSNVMDDEQEKKGHGRPTRKGTKLSHFGQKKARHGDVDRPKPRPRDRQMIQDRVKELRELVPNGAKCSIDALLDQTIKHMHFLKSVTSRAEKLKKYVHPEVVGMKNSKSSETQGHQNGASWAFDLGSQFGVCPIVVKDLDQTGHMLIEMLCEEHGLFLEIAQVIRQLNLTVLKGVLESRSDKTWAHFVVEASAGFQRMEIFWPLMQLLQRNSPVPSMF